MKTFHPHRGAIILLAVVMLLITAGGCLPAGDGRLGPIQTTPLQVGYPERENEPRLVINFGAAEIWADGQGHSFLEGSVRHNVSQLTPTISELGSRIVVEQRARTIPVNAVNQWELHFGTEKPFSLEINAGAYDGDWDLGGVPLRALIVNQGASRSTFDFSQPNPEVMERMVFKTGAASLEMRNLANAGFRQMSFDGGASSYILDFSGSLMRDADVTINAGLSNITLIIPADMPAMISVKDAISAVNTDKGFIKAGSGYYSPSWDESSAAPRLTVDAKIGIGNLTLRLAQPSGEMEQTARLR